MRDLLFEATFLHTNTLRDEIDGLKVGLRTHVHPTPAGSSGPAEAPPMPGVDRLESVGYYVAQNLFEAGEPIYWLVGGNVCQMMRGYAWIRDRQYYRCAMSREAPSPTTHDFGAGPVPAHKHPNGGGWVADTATVEESVFVGPEACVYNTAVVRGKSRVTELARVCGASTVDGDCVVRGEAYVHDSTLSGRVTLMGRARALMGASLMGASTLAGASVVRGPGVPKPAEPTKPAAATTVEIRGYNNRLCMFSDREIECEYMFRLYGKDLKLSRSNPLSVPRRGSRFAESGALTDEPVLVEYK